VCINPAAPFSLQRLLKGAGFNDIDIYATGGWDASLAQMVGLWLRRRSMSEAERVHFTGILYPLCESLLQREEGAKILSLADMAANSVMITGLCGIVHKEPLRG
jgi:hypothetical protein